MSANSSLDRGSSCEKIGKERSKKLGVIVC